MFEKLSIMNKKFEDELQNRISDTNGEMRYIEIIRWEILLLESSELFVSRIIRI